MQKKLIVLLTALLCLMPAVSYGEESTIDLAPNAKSAVLIDADTGAVIYEKNAKEQLPPASITKVMTMLLIMEALDRGEIKLTDQVRTSEFAASMGGSQIFLEAGEMMTVEEMLKGIAIASGNDASVAMAEHLAGTEENFVAKMNQRAKELGMNDTRFVNASGLPGENHYSTAHDIAIMSKELLKHEEITEFTSLYQDYLRKDSNKPFWLVNTNKLVRFYPGADGLKTGYTSEAKFCLTATAKRDDLRVISVVMGAPDSKTRNQEISAMFDYAFSQYESHPLVKRGEVVAKAKVNKGAEPEVNIVAPRNFGVLTKKGANPDEFEQEMVIEERIQAPVEQGATVGELIVKIDGEEVGRLNLIAESDIEKATWWQIMKRVSKQILFYFE